MLRDGKKLLTFKPNSYYFEKKKQNKTMYDFAGAPRNLDFVCIIYIFICTLLKIMPIKLWNISLHIPCESCHVNRSLALSPDGTCKNLSFYPHSVSLRRKEWCLALVVDRNSRDFDILIIDFLFPSKISWKLVYAMQEPEEVWGRGPVSSQGSCPRLKQSKRV